MKTPALPASDPLPSLLKEQEAARLAALHSYQLLDAVPMQALDELVQLATMLCHVPMALVSLVDHEQLWFKARTGTDLVKTSREHSFCQYALYDKGIYEIPNAADNPAFATHPLVANSPHIRFYAGVPLLTPTGQPLGTLCILDTVPRQLSDRQRDGLHVLARQVMSHLDLHRTRLLLEEERHPVEPSPSLGNPVTAEECLEFNNVIFVKQEQRLVRVATEDIHYIEALGDYVNIHTMRGERLTVYSTMKEMAARLSERHFARIHRKYIIRLDRIVSIEADTATLEAVREAGGSRMPAQVPIGNSYKAGLLRRLNVV